MGEGKMRERKLPTHILTYFYAFRVALHVGRFKKIRIIKKN